MFGAGTVLETKWILLYFVYGQIFFVAGLIISLETKRDSRLALARALPLLATFGILHGLTEWGYVGVSLLQSSVSGPLYRTALVAHILLLGASFAALLAFGVRLVLSRSFLWVAAALVGLWLLSGPLFGMITESPTSSSITFWEINARYLLALPGAVLACIGLVRQAAEVKTTDEPSIAWFLRGAGISFGVYALVGGLVVPDGLFFPSNWLNYSSFQRIFGIQPAVVRSICGVAILVTILKSMRIFKVQSTKALDEMRRAEVLAADRQRISRELHDGVIQAIYGAGLRLKGIEDHIEEHPAEARGVIQQVLQSLDGTIHALRQYIFDLEVSEGHRELESALAEMVQDVRLDTFLEAEFQIIGQRCCRLDRERSEHLIQICRESISNVVRHANATQVDVSLSYLGDRLSLRVEDNGCGMPERPGRGHGLSNMDRRAQLMGGELLVRQGEECGTTVEAIVPCGSGHGYSGQRGQPVGKAVDHPLTVNPPVVEETIDANPRPARR